MRELEKVKITQEMKKLLEEYVTKIESNESSNYISKEKTNEILSSFGFDENDNVEINDFYQFSKYFGTDKKMYLYLKPLKDNAKVGWDEIKNKKYGDIDFKDKTINFQSQMPRKNKTTILDR